MTMTQSIVVEKVLLLPADKIWQALTETSLIARWLMPNDFKPIIGHRFTFTTRPMGDWDGVVHCEVLACDPPRLLRYSWRGGSSANAAQGSPLDTMVTWTLTPADDGTHVRMEHAGFRLPPNQAAFDAMRPGWARVLDRVAHVATDLEAT
jgi:uncharacterized protein YndB with AHSA1/START domain